MKGAPKARVCYICGRQYMLHSFEIHITQCRDLFEKRENTKPPKERRKCPSDPTAGQSFGNSSSGMSMSRKELDSLNAASQQVWTAESLSKCRYCGRSFLPEKIGIHNKSCTADNPARRVDESVNRRVDNLGAPAQAYNVTNTTGLKGNQGYNLNAGEGQSYQDDGDLVECRDCGRSFSSQAFSKHTKICRKVFASKRKPFDSAKARAKDTELASYQNSHKTVTKTAGAGSRPTTLSTSRAASNGRPSSSGGGYSGGQQQQQQSHISQQQQDMPKWKADSNAFRQAMRNARMVSRAEKESKATGVPLHLLLPPGGGRGGSQMGGGAPQVDPSFMQCPHCGRSFNQKAGERHIPQCQSIINKPSRLSRNSGQPSYSTLSSPPPSLPVPSSRRSSGGMSSSSSGARQSQVLRGEDSFSAFDSGNGGDMARGGFTSNSKGASLGGSDGRNGFSSSVASSGRKFKSSTFGEPNDDQGLHAAPQSQKLQPPTSQYEQQYQQPPQQRYDSHSDPQRQRARPNSVGRPNRGLGVTSDGYRSGQPQSSSNSSSSGMTNVLRGEDYERAEYGRNGTVSFGGGGEASEAAIQRRIDAAVKEALSQRSAGGERRPFSGNRNAVTSTAGGGGMRSSRQQDVNAFSSSPSSRTLPSVAAPRYPSAGRSRR